MAGELGVGLHRRIHCQGNLTQVNDLTGLGIHSGDPAPVGKVQIAVIAVEDAVSVNLLAAEQVIAKGIPCALTGSGIVLINERACAASPKVALRIEACAKGSRVGIVFHIDDLLVIDVVHQHTASLEEQVHQVMTVGRIHTSNGSIKFCGLDHVLCHDLAFHCFKCTGSLFIALAEAQTGKHNVHPVVFRLMVIFHKLQHQNVFLIRFQCLTGCHITLNNRLLCCIIINELHTANLGIIGQHGIDTSISRIAVQQVGVYCCIVVLVQHVVV